MWLSGIRGLYRFQIKHTFLYVGLCPPNRFVGPALHSHSADELTSHSTRLPKNASQVAGYKSPKYGDISRWLALHSHSAKSPKYGDISRWLTATKWLVMLCCGSGEAGNPRSGSASPCGAFGRTLNF